ncbi:MAG: hypothetical protein Q4B42_00715 [Oscillospiraceae bacterium]|nr:hypothetical protein [Oscillospiraceae bacterium]
MSGEVFTERLREAELEEFRAFCLESWGEKHPLIHNEATFNYYFRRGEKLNFALARDAESGDILSVCGYILANSSSRPDAWISYLVSKKGAPFGLAYRLFDYIIETTNCRSLACNNIRKKTRGLYELRGWHFGQLKHYYRLNESLERFTLAEINERDIPPLNGSVPIARASCSPSHAEGGGRAIPAALSGEFHESSRVEIRKINGKEELESFEESVLAENRPYKDSGYLERRYLRSPWFAYELLGAFENARPLALLVHRKISAGAESVLRVVDFIGDCAALKGFGAYLDEEMKRLGAQFCDFFAAGLKPELMRAAGFALREDDVNIIPNYLEPPLMQNSDFYYFTSDDPAVYRVFKADGDQDRPNIILD